MFERVADLFETLVKVFETPADLFDKAADVIKTPADLLKTPADRLKTDVHFFCAGADLPEMVADHFNLTYFGADCFRAGYKAARLSVPDPLRNA